MKGTLALSVLFLYVFLATSQITFSRNWVRGRYPAGTELLTSDREDPSFVRATKDDSKVAGDIVLNPRSPKSTLPITPVNLNYRLFQELMRRWKPMRLDRFKDKEPNFDVPLYDLE